MPGDSSPAFIRAVRVQEDSAKTKELEKESEELDLKISPSHSKAFLDSSLPYSSEL